MARELLVCRHVDDCFDDFCTAFAEVSGGVRIRLDYDLAINGKPRDRGETDVMSWLKLIGG
jgi:hypothetical protein